MKDQIQQKVDSDSGAMPDSMQRSMAPPQFKLAGGGPIQKQDAGNQVRGPIVVSRGSGPVVDNTSQGWDHYFNGGGAAVQIGAATTNRVIGRSGFTTPHNRIVGGLTTALSGEFSVLNTWSVADFHLGRTNVLYDIQVNGDDCTVTYTIYDRDGFWDANFIWEQEGAASSSSFGSSSYGSSSYGGYGSSSYGSGRGGEGLDPATNSRVADGMGPNLELDGGTPYPYEPTILRYHFKTSAYKNL